MAFLSYYNMAGPTDPSVRAWKAEYRSLWQRCHAVDLERQRAAYNRVGQDVDSLQEEESDLVRRREAAQVTLGQELAAQREELSRVQEQIDALSRGDAAGAARLAAVRRRRPLDKKKNDTLAEEGEEEKEEEEEDDLGLRGFEENLAAFKRRMRKEYEALRASEVDLLRDMESDARRFEAWSTSDVLPQKSEAPQKVRPFKKEETVAERVAAINEFLGVDPRGGWDVDEHETFERLWQKEGPKVDVAEAAKLFPRRSLADLKRKCQSYADRLKALAERRRLLGDWRQKKDKEKKSVVVIQKQQETTKSQPKARRPQVYDADEDRRLAARTAASAWRALKTLQAERDQRAQAQEKELQERREAERRAARRVKQRAALDAARKEKEENLREKIDAAAALEASEKKTLNKKAPPRVDLDANAKKALRAAAERRVKILQKTQAADLSRDRLKRVAADMAPKKKPTPKLFLRPTTASKFREYTVEEADTAESLRTQVNAHARPIALAGYDLNFAGRAIPTWRQQP